MRFTIPSIPSRRRNDSPVSASVSHLEERSLLSGVAVYPLPANVAETSSVEPLKAAPANFQGVWSLSVEGRPVFIGLSLSQDNTTVTGSFRVTYGGDHDVLFTSAVAAKKTLSIHSEDSNFPFDLKLKLKGDGTLKGFMTTPGGPKAQASATRQSA